MYNRMEFTAAGLIVYAIMILQISQLLVIFYDTRHYVRKDVFAEFMKAVEQQFQHIEKELERIVR